MTGQLVGRAGGALAGAGVALPLAWPGMPSTTVLLLVAGAWIGWQLAGTRLPRRRT